VESIRLMIALTRSEDQWPTLQRAKSVQNDRRTVSAQRNDTAHDQVMCHAAKFSGIFWRLHRLDDVGYPQLRFQRPMAVEIAQLVADHHAVVYRYAYRLCGSAADAEDLTQQVYLTAQQKIDQLHDDQKARNWLFSILRNRFLADRRRRMPLPASGLGVDLTFLPDATEAVEDAGDERIDAERLQRAIDGLPDDFKLVLVMYYFEHCSYREIAARMAIPIGTVMSRLSRAKSHLRRQLTPAGVHADQGVRQSQPNWRPRNGN
jgi:RNA polymerase sigma-70 factor, ECF subfamily